MQRPREGSKLTVGLEKARVSKVESGRRSHGSWGWALLASIKECGSYSKGNRNVMEGLRKEWLPNVYHLFSTGFLNVNHLFTIFNSSASNIAVT